MLFAAISNDSYSSSADENELIKRIQRKDPYALEELYDLYKRLLFGMILSIVKNRNEAVNLLLEVFETVWEKAASFNTDRENVYSWLVRLTRSRAIRFVHLHKAPEEETSAVIEGDNYDPLKTTIYSDRTELVKKALTKIPEEQLEVLKIAYYRGMTQQEIADSLNVTLRTVKTRTKEGMLKFKQVIENFIIGHE